MAEERITETVDRTGNVERRFERDTAPGHVTVNTAPASSGGGGALLAILALGLIAVLVYFLVTGNSSESRKDNAVAEAASDIGAAAEKAGNAVEKAAGKVEAAAETATK